MSGISFIKRHESESVKHVLDAVNLIVIIWNAIAFVVIRKTKRVPKVAKILSLNLMTSDLFTLLMAILRRWSPEPISRDIALTMGGTAMIVNIFIVTAMSLERLVLFSNGVHYLKQFRTLRAHLIMAGIWIILLVFLPLIRYIACPDEGELEECIRVGKLFGVFPVLILCLAVSVASYTKIFFLLRKIKQNLRNCYQGFHFPEKQGRGYYRTTILMFFYFLSTILFGFLIALTAAWPDHDIYGTSTVGFDVVATIAATLDAALYVFWYQECRMELFKLFVSVCPRLSGQIERMCLEVFNVVLSERRPMRSLDNKNGHPLARETTEEKASVPEQRQN